MFHFLVLLLLICNNVSSEELPILNLAQGKVQGSIRKNLLGGTFYAFQGIPYAEPPIGSLRFKNPEPGLPWEGIWNGTKEGPACTQPNWNKGPGINGQEDCLYLNVYTPTISSNGDLKAVMVLLHGGGFTVGNGGEDMYGPDFLLTEDIIYVAMNYRLNLFGFLSFEDPSIEVYGNMGLKDQVMGLKWVQENIKTFGGDPNKVTIFGESAGGANVALMLLSPLAKGLFHRAISQSGVPSLPWAFTDRRYKNFASYLNFTGDMDNQGEIFDFLNSKKSDELISAQFRMLPKDEMYIAELTQLGIVIENPDSNPGAFITKDPLEMFKNGEFAQVPVIMGFTKDEGVLFTNRKTFINLDFTENERLVPRYFNLERGSPTNKEVGNKIKEFYYGDKTPNNNTLPEFIMMMSDISFTHGILKTRRAIVEKSSEPLYFYLFNYISSLNLMSKMVKSPFPTACHADDNGYTFSVRSRKLEIEKDSVEMRGIHRMVKLWTTFAKMGDPNQHESDELLNIKWPKASLDNFQYLVLQDNMELGSDLILERDQFWTDLETSLGIK